jgi:hypothetical protein
MLDPDEAGPYRREDDEDSALGLGDDRCVLLHRARLAGAYLLPAALPLPSSAGTRLSKVAGYIGITQQLEKMRQYIFYQAIRFVRPYCWSPFTIAQIAECLFRKRRIGSVCSRIACEQTGS